MEFNLKGKVVVITGGAQGIGKQIAADFLASGSRVIILDVKQEVLQQVKQEFSNYESLDTFCVNVTNLEQVTDTADKIIDKHSKIDILINNAGITRDNLLLRLKENDWDQVLAVNLKGVYCCSKAILKYMVKQRSGKIVNISSIVGLRGNPGQTNYGASNAAVIGFTKSLAREVANRGITVNAVAPGYIKTAMTENIPEKAKQDLLSAIPMQRLGTPQDVSKAAVFLASEFSDYITGKVITVDGGML
jgi:3-oxoacyl-[acyl-carrier protein] reductase